jgi:4-amino-4-deoxy-L-arabinose transferase-like glycosyltransferase
MPAGRLLPRIVIALAVLAAAIRLYRPAYDASDLVITPDSLEYAVGAERIADLGRFDLEIERASYPPKVPPWFSLCLAPAYRVHRGELGAGVHVVFLFALAGVLAAAAIGRRLAGDWGAAAAAAALTASAQYGWLAREIMTDVPATALTLLLAWQFLRILERERPLSSWILAGLACALAFAFRSENLALLLPFAALLVRRAPRRPAKLAALAVPALAIVVATVIYDRSAFGDWRRNGYMFWCPVPYDYPELTFSLAYVPANLAALVHRDLLPGWILGVAGAGVLLAKRSRETRILLLFAALGVVPGIVFHLLFHFPQVRFDLPLSAIACVLGGAGLATLVPERARLRASFGAAVLALVPLALPRLPSHAPNRRTTADELARATPEDAWVVTLLEPVYLEPFFRGTARRVVPYDRQVEYASKLVAPRRIDPLSPPARGPDDHRAEGLLRGGARDVCAFTADEAPERLLAAVRQGIPVYVELRFLPQRFPLRRYRDLGLDLEPSPGVPWLARLALR